MSAHAKHPLHADLASDTRKKKHLHQWARTFAALMLGLVPLSVWAVPYSTQIVSIHDDGTAAAQHPAQYAVDGSSSTYWQAATGTVRSVLTISFAGPRHVLAVDILGSGGTANSTVSLFYQTSSGYVPFISAIGQRALAQSGTQRLDVSQDNIEASSLQVVFDGPDVPKLQVQEVGLYTESSAGRVQRIAPTAVRASKNSSYYSSEFELFDGNPLSLWLVDLKNSTATINSWVDDYVKSRFSFSRATTPALQGYVEADLPPSSAVAKMRVYVSPKGAGSYQVLGLAGGTWASLQSMRAVPVTPGWIEIPVGQTLDSVRILVQGTSDSTSVGRFGELEVWGTNTVPATSKVVTVTGFPSGFSFDTLASDVFAWDPVTDGRTPTLAVAFDAALGVAPSVQLNGVGRAASFSATRGDTLVAIYPIRYGELKQGTNFVQIGKLANGNQAYARGFVVQNLPETGNLAVAEDNDTWNDGTLLEVPAARSSATWNLKSPAYLAQVDAFTTDGSSVAGVSALVGTAWVPLARNVASDGSTSFSGSVIAKALRVEGDSSRVSELRIWGSRTEASPILVSPIYPGYSSQLPVENMGFMPLYGETSDPDAVVKVNGIVASRLGQLFWVNLSQIAFDQTVSGACSAAISVTNSAGVVTTQTQTWYLEDSAYELVLADIGTIVNTAAASYSVHGTINSFVTRLLVNGQAVTTSNGAFSVPVSLVPGLNLIKVEQVDLRNGKFGHTYYLQVFRDVQALQLQITSVPSKSYTTASQIILQGAVQGLNPVSVVVQGKAAAVSGQYFSSQSIPLIEGSNTITATATDGGGASITRTVTVIRASNIPVVTVTSPVQNSFIGSAYVTVAGTIAASAPATVFVNGVVATQDAQGGFTIQLSQYDGPCTLTVTATDQAGNSAVPVVRSCVVDSTPPAAFDAQVTPSSWTNSTITTLVFSTTDATSGIDHYEYSLDGGAFSTVVSPYGVNIPDDGTHTFVVNAFDRAGNVRTSSVQAFIDRTAPSGVKLLRGVPGGDHIELRWQVDEADFDTVIVSRTPAWPDGVHTLGKNIGVRPDPNESPDHFEFSVDDPGLVSGAAYVYSVRIADRAGNLGPVSQSDQVTVGLAVQATEPNKVTVAEYSGVTLVVPAASLPDGVSQVQIKEETDPFFADYADKPILGSVYKFSAVSAQSGDVMDSVVFDQPVMASIKFDTANLWDNMQASQLGVYYFDTVWNTWMKVPDALIDAEHSTAIFSVNHFTEFSVQATVQPQLTPQEIADVPFTLAGNGTQHSGLSVSPQGGTVSTQMTEFSLPGRNGFGFTVKRLYDTSTAKTDMLQIKAARSLSEIGLGNLQDWHSRQVDDTVVQALAAANTTSLYPDQVAAFKKNLLKQGDYWLSFGNGWRLNLPYMTVSETGAQIRLPSGGMYSLSEMSVANTTSTSNTRDLTLKNSKTESFTVVLHQQRFSEITTKDFQSDGVHITTKDTSRVDSTYMESTDVLPWGPYGRPDPLPGMTSTMTDAWKTTGTVLLLANGERYEFDSYGRVTSGYDPTGKNSYTVSPPVGTVTENVLDSPKMIISDTLGNTIEIAYIAKANHPLLRPLIAQITQKRGTNTIRSTSYTQSNDGRLTSATDAKGRNYSYGYEMNLVVSGTDMFAKLTGISQELVGQVDSELSDSLDLSKLSASGLNLSGDVQFQLVDVLSSASGFGIGEQTIDYSLQTIASYKANIFSKWDLAISQSSSGRMQLQQMLLPISLTTSSGSGGTTLVTSYEFDASYFVNNGKQFSIDKTTVHDSRSRTEYNYEMHQAEVIRPIVDVNADSITYTNEDPHYIPLQSSMKQFDRASVDTSHPDAGLVLSTTSSYEDKTLRLASQTSSRSSAIYLKEEYSYDAAGNVRSYKKTNSWNGTNIVMEKYSLFSGSTDADISAVNAKLAGVSVPALLAVPSAITGYAAPSGGVSRLDALLWELTKVGGVTVGNNTVVADQLRGQKSTYTAESLNSPATTSVWSGSAWLTSSYEYDGATGELTKSTSPLGAIVQYAHNYPESTNTYTLTITRQAGPQADGSNAVIQTSQVYSASTGFKTSDTDGNNGTTTFVYDKIGRVTSIVKPSGPSAPASSTTIAYNDTAMTVTVTKQARGQIETYTFDALGRVLEVLKHNRPRDLDSPSSPAALKSGTPEDITHTFGYDGWNELTSYLAPGHSTTSGTDTAHRTEFVYDSNGRVAETRFPYSGSTVPSRKATFDATKMETTNTDELHVVTVEKTDFEGRLLMRSGTVGGIAYYEQWWYDAAGNQVGYRDRNGNITVTSYNTRNQVTKVTHPSTTSFYGKTSGAVLKETTTYNDDGFAVSKAVILDSTTRTTTFVVDSLGRTIKTLTTYTDHPVNGSAAASKSTVAWTFYDKVGNPTKQYNPMAGNGTTTFVSGAPHVSYTYTVRNKKMTETDQLGNITTFSYDGDDNLVSVQDPRDTLTKYTGDFAMNLYYDDQNRLVLARLPKVSGQSTVPTVKFSYDVQGNVLSRTDASGKVTTFSYTPRNWVSTQTITGLNGANTAVSYVTTNSYDLAGNLIAQADGQNNMTSYEYDSLRRQTKVTQPEGNWEALIYDLNGNKISDIKRYETKFTYDQLNRLISQTDARNQTTSFLYDISGKVAQSVSPIGTETTTYDERGLPYSYVNSRGKNWLFTYDAAGNLAQAKDPMGVVKTSTYNARNQVTAVAFTKADGTSVLSQSMEYDEGGALKSATDGVVTSAYNGSASAYQPDPYGLVTSMVESSTTFSNTVNYTYDAYQNLTALQVSGLSSQNYGYDQLQRLSSILGITGSAGTGVIYDDLGRLSSVASANGTITSYSYDSNSRQISSVLKDAQGKSLRTDELKYDQDNNVVSKKVDGRFNSSYDYDERGSLAFAYLEGRFTADIAKPQNAVMAERDTDGQKTLTSIEGEQDLGLDYNSRSIGVDFGGTREVYGFVVTPRAQSRITARQIEVYLSDYNSKGMFTKYSDLKVTLKADGSIEVVFREPQQARYAKLHCTFDERNAKNVALDVSTARNSKSVLVKAYYFATIRTENYVYDEAGRRSSSTIAHPQGEADNLSQIYSYYDNSELLKSDGVNYYAYDDNGNLIAKGPNKSDLANGSISITPGAGAWKYDYDPLNRLTSVKKYETASSAYIDVATYVYNHKNERIMKTDAAGKVTKWVYDGNGNVLAVMYPDGTNESLFWLEGKIVAHTLTNGSTTTTEFFGTDALGSTVITTDASGKVVSQNDTTPFGTQTGSSGFQNLALRYTGKDYDSDTGLYYFNARWYDPTAGRFITEDPIKDGSLWYAYVGNNPMTFTDPTGLAVPLLIIPVTVIVENAPEIFATILGVLGLASHAPSHDFSFENDAQSAPDVVAGAAPKVYSVTKDSTPIMEQDPGFIPPKIHAQTPPSVATPGLMEQTPPSMPSADVGGYTESFPSQNFAPDIEQIDQLPPEIASQILAATSMVYPQDFQTKSTKQESYMYDSQGQARQVARTQVGNNPVQVEENKLRSQDGVWQYRAKDVDVDNGHVHLERLDPDTGEVLTNYHLNWAEKAE